MSSNIKIKKICIYCRQEFIARTTVTKYCSHNCARRAYKANVRELKIQLSNNTNQQAPIQEIKLQQNPEAYFELNTLDYLTVRQAAILLKCDRRTIYRLVKSGKLPCANLSIRRIRILKQDIDNLFKINVTSNIVRKIDSLPIEETPLRDCFTIGQIQEEYSISPTSLKTLINNHNIPKFQKGKFVYIPKREIEHILKKIQSGNYSG